jgi:hypothetical protein
MFSDVLIIMGNTTNLIEPITMKTTESTIAKIQMD